MSVGRLLITSSKQLLKVWRAGIDDLLRSQPMLRDATLAAENAVLRTGGASIIDPKKLLSNIKAAQTTFKIGNVLPRRMTVQGAGRGIQQASRNQPKPRVRIANPHESAKAKARKIGLKGNTRRETQY